MTDEESSDCSCGSRLFVVPHSGAHFFPVSQIEQDGYAVNSTDVEKRLTGEAASLGRIELLAVQEMDAVYEQMGARYVGEEKRTPQRQLPDVF